MDMEYVVDLGGDGGDKNDKKIHCGNISKISKNIFKLKNNREKKAR